MINTLRSIIADDSKWFTDIKAFYQHFKYTTTMTEDVVAWWNRETGLNLTPVFNQYLRHVDIPLLELNFDEANHTVMYKWRADEPGFAMPVPGRRSRLLADAPPHSRVANPLDSTHPRPVPGRG